MRNRREMERRIKDIIDEMNLDMDIQPYYDRMRGFVDKALHRQSFN